MIYDLQKASLLKRASAWILDMILLCVLVVGVASVMSGALKYDSYFDTMERCKEKYETQYGVSFDITEDDYNAKTPEDKKVYDDAMAAMNADEEALKAYNMLISLSMVIVTVSVLVSYLALEFVVPLLFGNGQTVGKKIFAIGLMKANGVKINAISLFVRTVLGKFTIETMIPLLIVMMMLLGVIGIVGPLILLGIAVVQVVTMVTSKTNSFIHDAMAQTVAVDIHSQLIFGDEDQLMEYKKQAHEEMVRRRSY
jgi:uncharacterized RDD family membrane protein YckC